MHFHCRRVQGNFPAEKLHLENQGPARLIWDEHGGTFVLRVEGLEVLEPADGETGIFLEVALPEPGSLAQQIESFAGRHNLRLGLKPAVADLAETPILAACHIPGKNLFIFCEEPRLTFRLLDATTMELQVTGVFKSRRVPCQETDVVIHLDLAAICRLLGGLLAWSGERQ